MYRHRFLSKKLIVILIMFLCLATFLSACGNTVKENDSTVSPTATPEADADISGDDGLSGSDWPQKFSLHEAYADSFMLGTIYIDESREGADKEITLTHFNAITPENIMKPEYMQPTEGNFNFTESDKMINFAQENKLNAIGHTLAWHQQSGDWLGKNVSRDVAIEQLRNHIKNIAGKYKGKITSWDVVNEAIADNTSLPSDGDWTQCLRQTQWLTSIGPDYLELAFTFAHEADPDAMLYYNDYNLDIRNKAEIVYAMVKDLRQKGIPVDGIGMQGHYNIDTSIGSVENSLKMFSELGVEVSITELDVSVNGAAASGLTEEQEIQQGIVYAKLFNVFKEYKDTIARVTFWGYVDNKSWRNDRFPCLFNADYTPKEAAYAVLDPDKYLELNQPEEEEKVIKTAQAGYGTPVIDGEVDELWAQCPEILVNNMIMAWEGAKGAAKVLWDETHVYVLFEVQDSVLNKQSANVYEHDSIEIFLDQNNGKATAYDEDDGQYRVNYEGEESFGTIPDTEGFTSKAKIVEGGYLVELAIPLIGSAKEGMVFGFDAQVNDSDAEGTRQSIAKFNDLTNNSYQTAENWGNLELIK